MQRKSSSNILCCTREKSFGKRAGIGAVRLLGLRLATGGARGAGAGGPVRRRRRVEAAELLVCGRQRGRRVARPKQRVERRGAVREALAAALLQTHLDATTNAPAPLDSRRRALSLSLSLVCETLEDLTVAISERLRGDRADRRERRRRSAKG